MYIIHALRGAGKCTLRTYLFRCLAQAICISYSAEFSGRHT
jgi:hypothetical protein